LREVSVSNVPSRNRLLVACGGAVLAVVAKSLLAGPAAGAAEAGGWFPFLAALGPATELATGLTGELAGGFLYDRYKEAPARFQDLLRNEDLARAVGETISLTLREAANGLSHGADRTLLEAIAKEAPARWLAHPEPPIPERELPGLFSGAAAEFGTHPVLKREEWEAILNGLLRETISSTPGGPSTSRRRALSDDAQTRAVDALHDRFAHNLRQVVVNSPNAHSKLILSLLGEIHAASGRAADHPEATALQAAAFQGIETALERMDARARAEHETVINGLASLDARLGRFSIEILHAIERQGDRVVAALEGAIRAPVPDRKPVHLPYQSLDTLFKGRDEFLDRLAASLQAADGRATALVGKAVHGLGGVGKTRLSVEYAWRRREEYRALLFVPADSPDLLRSSLAALAGPRILNLPEQDDSEEEARAAAAVRWLQDHPGWLLILDNADTPEAATAVEALLASLRDGQVLITSRLTRWSGAVDPIELDVLELDAAAAFLLERTERRRRKQATDTGDALTLAGELDGLALALEQAGAYIAAERVSIASYLADWRAHRPDVQGWHDEREMKYRCSLAVTWQVTMDHLGPGETALLRLLSWLAPEPLPLWAFEGEAIDAIWEEALALMPAAAEDAAPPKLAAALRRLADFSMLRWETENGEDTVTVHRVVQEIVRTRLPEPERREWLTLSLRLLEAALPEGSPRDVRAWPRWKPLRPHVASAVDFGTLAGITSPTTSLMGRLGFLLWGMALYAEAEALERRALVLDETHLGPDHTTVAVRLNNLAQTLRATNRLAEAEPLMRRALAIDERSNGPDHPEVAIYLNNLAQVLQATNRQAEAEPLMRRALAIDERSYGLDNPRVATRLNNLAALLQATNRLAEAEPLMRRALAIDERSYGLGHPEVATRLNNLAQVLQATNRLAEAEPLMRRALAIDERSYGLDYPDVARDLNNLAQLLQATNRLAEAEPLSRRMVGIILGFIRLTGHRHPHREAALRNHAGVLRALGRGEMNVRAEIEALIAEYEGPGGDGMMG
jgi:tetratricopeptide (TPR) repeat protein